METVRSQAGNVGEVEPRWPRVIANFAITWDGRISTRKRTPSHFSSASDKRRLLEIRALGDAVLAGAATVSADTMSLGLPEGDLREQRISAGRSPSPLRVIVSQSGRMSVEWRVFQTMDVPLVVYATERMEEQIRDRVRARAELRLQTGGSLDLGRVLSELRERDGVQTLVCEGGGRLILELLRLGAVDELYLTLCPWIFGGKTGVSLTGAPGLPLPVSAAWELVELRPLPETGECFTQWRFKR